MLLFFFRFFTISILDFSTFLTSLFVLSLLSSIQPIHCSQFLSPPAVQTLWWMSRQLIMTNRSSHRTHSMALLFLEEVSPKLHPAALPTASSQPWPCPDSHTTSPRLCQVVLTQWASSIFPTPAAHSALFYQWDLCWSFQWMFSFAIFKDHKQKWNEEYQLVLVLWSALFSLCFPHLMSCKPFGKLLSEILYYCHFACEGTTHGRGGTGVMFISKCQLLCVPPLSMTGINQCSSHSFFFFFFLHRYVVPSVLARTSLRATIFFPVDQQVPSSYCERHIVLWISSVQQSLSEMPPQIPSRNDMERK